jgi:hypothetical protein
LVSITLPIKGVSVGAAIIPAGFTQGVHGAFGVEKANQEYSITGSLHIFTKPEFLKPDFFS